MPAGRFVIFAQGRTGSTLLAELLGDHAEVHCEQEILSHRVWAPLHYVEWRARTSLRPVYGFRVKIYQLTEDQGVRDPGEFLRALVSRGWCVVHLERRNLFRLALSGIARRRRGRPHTRAGERSEHPQVYVEPRRLVAEMQFRARMRAAETRALNGVPHQRIVYEDDLYTPEAQARTSARVLRDLGLEPEAVRSDLRPNTPADPRDIISNFGEVEAALRGHRFEAELRDALAPG